MRKETKNYEGDGVYEMQEGNNNFRLQGQPLTPADSDRFTNVNRTRGMTCSENRERIRKLTEGAADQRFSDDNLGVDNTSVDPTGSRNTNSY